MTEILTPVARLVGGHPMVNSPLTDPKTNLPRLGADGQPMHQYYIGVAIPKGSEAHWRETAWGQVIQQTAAAGWPNGEFNAPTFAWKITDGDSQIPNKKGKKPAEREGYPGHWVLNCSTTWPIGCFHAGKYEPTQQIQNKDEIKPGDYCRVLIDVKDNSPSQSPGVYLNPSLFELSRAGQLIVLGDAPDAGAVFGGGAPQNVGQPATQGATPAAGVQPAHDFLTGAPTPMPTAPAPMPKTYIVQGTAYTADQLKQAGWTDAQIATLG